MFTAREFQPCLYFWWIGNLNLNLKYKGRTRERNIFEQSRNSPQLMTITELVILVVNDHNRKAGHHMTTPNFMIFFVTVDNQNAVIVKLTHSLWGVFFWKLEGNIGFQQK